MKKLLTLLLTLFLFSSVYSEVRVVDNVEHRDGIAYAIGENKPFSGRKIWKYGNDQKGRETYYVDGKKEGIETQWFNDGQKRSIAKFQDGNQVGSTDRISWIVKSAQSGDAEEQYKLAKLYLTGKKISEIVMLKSSYKHAFEYFKKSALQGHKKSQNELGILYLKGRGTKQDKKQALFWLKKSATNGFAEAQINLGQMYAKGKDVERNYKEAVKWYSKAAEQGDSNAYFHLGKFYVTIKEYKKSFDYMKKAASSGHSYAKYVLDSTLRELIKIKRLAEKGNARAQNKLAFAYMVGNYGEINYKKAVKWFKKSAQKGNAEAQVYLGAMYIDGTGVEKNTVKAKYWIKRSKDQGNKGAKTLWDKLNF